MGTRQDIIAQMAVDLIVVFYSRGGSEWISDKAVDYFIKSYRTER